MGRPKGIKNKPKAHKAAKQKVEKAPETEAENGLTLVEGQPPTAPEAKRESKIQGHGIGEWKPSPDMGGVKDPKKDRCANCHHATNLHYGSATNWCNLGGCQCQAYAE